MRALVTGATGYVGSRLVTALLDAGHEVVATARDERRLREIGWDGRVQPLAMDVLDADSVHAALQDAGRVDVAYYLVHGLGEGDYESSDAQAARLFADAAAAARVGRIVYLGGFRPVGEVSDHLASRGEVGDVLAAGPVDVVALQAAVILGAGSTSFEIIRHLVDRLPVVLLPQFMGHQVQPIAVDDVLHYLVHAARPQLAPGTYDIAGHDRLSYADLARTYARVAGLRRVFLPVPYLPVSVAAQLLGPLLPVPSPLVGDLLQSLSRSMVSSDHAIRASVPDPPGGLTPLEQAIERALQSPTVGGRPEPEADVADLDDPAALAASDPDWAGPRD